MVRQKNKQTNTQTKQFKPVGQFKAETSSPESHLAKFLSSWEIQVGEMDRRNKSNSVCRCSRSSCRVVTSCSSRSLGEQQWRPGDSGGPVARQLPGRREPHRVERQRRHPAVLGLVGLQPRALRPVLGVCLRPLHRYGQDAVAQGLFESLSLVLEDRRRFLGFKIV